MKFNVAINPTTSGAHSAILNLDDTSTTGVDYQTMNVVIAAEQFTSGNNYTVTKIGTIGRNQTTSFFYNVPAGTPAFKVDMTAGGAGPGQVRFLRFHPYGVAIESNASTAFYNPPACGGTPPPAACIAAVAVSRTAANPQAGVWEVVVEARRTSDAEFAPFTLTASILGATVAISPNPIASATIGTPVAINATLTNIYGAFTGRATGSTLGSAYRATPSIGDLGLQEFTVNVASGSTSFRATIGGTSDPAADLDLYVLRNGVVVGQSADGDSEESVTITNPAAGTYTVRIEGYAVPAGTTTYNYIDVFANPAFGSVSVTDANALRAAGTSWTVPGTVTAKAVPSAGRVLLGTVQVRTNENILIGSGDVIVQNVTP